MSVCDVCRWGERVEGVCRKKQGILKGNSSEFNMRNLEIQEAVQPSLKYHLSQNMSETLILEFPIFLNKM